MQRMNNKETDLEELNSYIIQYKTSGVTIGKYDENNNAILDNPKVIQ